MKDTSEKRIKNGQKKKKKKLKRKTEIRRRKQNIY
jgi:hypothetical protein